MSAAVIVPARKELLNACSASGEGQSVLKLAQKSLVLISVPQTNNEMMRTKVDSALEQNFNRLAPQPIQIHMLKEFTPLVSLSFHGLLCALLTSMSQCFQ